MDVLVDALKKILAKAPKGMAATTEIHDIAASALSAIGARGEPVPINILEANEHDIESLIEEALNAACRSIQDRIGQTDGGIAGMYFSGGNRDDFDKLFRQYIETERLYRESA